MTTITNIDLPAKLLRAAKQYQAVRDVRSYLEGTLLHPDGHIAATNGHAMFWAQCDEAKLLDNALIMQICGAVPASAETAHIALHLEEKAGYMWFSDAFGISVPKSGRKTFRAFSLIDGTYPDLERVLPKGEPVATEAIGINPEYIGKANAALKALGARYPTVEMQLRGINSSIEMLLKGTDYNAKVIVMPVRLT